MMQRCCDCGEPVQPGRFYREIMGWERIRAQGGANMVTMRHETGRVRCIVCADLAKLHGQGRLV
jgi:hypothetical protein